MKRIGNLYNDLLDIEKIKSIILLAAKGKKKRKEVVDALEHIDEVAQDILDMLMRGEFALKPVRHKTITENGKKRELTISPFFPNRILDYIMVTTLKPYIRRSMYEYCIGNVDGRGIVYGKKVIERKKYKYHLKLDIRKFYPSVDSKLLYAFIESKIKDKRFLKLCKAIVLSCDNLPIGSYYSQWFSNWYLESVDHAIKEKLKVPFYIRYVDDMLLMGNNKRALRRAMFEIERLLKEKGLSLKREEQVKRAEEAPIDLIGFRFRTDKTVLRGRTFSRLTRRLKKIRKRKHICVSQARSVLSYIGWLTQTRNGCGYYARNIKPYAPKKKMRRIISEYDKKIETFCIPCANRGKCEQPCRMWNEKAYTEMFGGTNYESI